MNNNRYGTKEKTPTKFYKSKKFFILDISSGAAKDGS